jgi:hypothetical protein
VVREINRWWSNYPGEIYWFETTDRDDIGADLNAPAEKEGGGDYWSYNLVQEVRPGDIVAHYFQPAGTIQSWSRVTGQAFQSRVFWGAHGAASGRGAVAPYWRPGWRAELDGPHRLSESVTLTSLRQQADELAAIKAALEEREQGPIYFPFQFYGAARELRGFQSYLTKLPRAVIEAVPELAPILDAASGSEIVATGELSVAGYVAEDEDVETAPREAVNVDPEAVDRGLRGHRRTQNQLAAAVERLGLSPHKGRQPDFDLGWWDGEVFCVAEVKSLSDRNEERQLRLAIGQVLRYAHQLRESTSDVRAFIAVERKPKDASWEVLCGELGITLIWPAVMERRVRLHRS